MPATEDLLRTNNRAKQFVTPEPCTKTIWDERSEASKRLHKPSVTHFPGIDPIGSYIYWVINYLRSYLTVLIISSLLDYLTSLLQKYLGT